MFQKVLGLECCIVSSARNIILGKSLKDNQALGLQVFRNKVMTRRQHGFVKNRLCQTNIIAFFDNVIRLVDQDNAVDEIDFNTALYKVDHSLLFDKLESYGMNGPITKWVQS